MKSALFCLSKVDGIFMGSTPLIPVNGTTSRRRLLTLPSGYRAARYRPKSFQSNAIAISVFFMSFFAPSSPGAHIITAILTAGDSETPIIAPVVSAFAVGFQANVSVLVDGSSAAYVEAPYCKEQLIFAVNVSGPAGQDTPTGNATLSLVATSPLTGLLSIDLGVVHRSRRSSLCF
jgi:hypothetical protein